MTPELAGFVALFTAAAGAVGFFFRGQVRATNADKLWDAAEGLRKEQSSEIIEQRKEIKELTERVVILEAELRAVKQERDGFAAQLDRLSHENDRLRDHIDRLTQDNIELRKA